MKVILKNDVKDVGRAGELVNVKRGFARNFLLPRKLAVEATEKREKEFAHLQQMAEVRKKKAVEARKAVLSKISGLTLTFKVDAAETDKIFGSVTNLDISKQLSEQGYEVDRRDILIEEPIKILGQHKAIVKLGEGMTSELKISVERDS
ncbi:MAG: 50S ribosomal protein L9 [Bdellovibrionales bacterium CG10_big_fil_rev_8_21_14_0_10_45_34]|nr:MAG: 50S ribosomal protein L9 [Bdellovibrionales bacterium CG10_big_fil_rev_8_21_14_0_10_45_34]